MPIDPIEAQKAIVADLEAQLERASAVLDGMMLYAQHIGTENATSQPSTKKTKKSKRRMRLGSKKRVVFQLIEMGLDTVDLIADRLEGSEIDRRNVRDIVRDGISKDDIGGSLEDRFVLTAFGKELLEKASKEDDWDNYSSLIAPITFTPVNLNQQNVGFIQPPEPPVLPPKMPTPAPPIVQDVPQVPTTPMPWPKNT